MNRAKLLKCQGATNGQSFCLYGFIQTAPCFGIAGTPMCCNEEWCGRYYEQYGGKPPEHLVSNNRGSRNEKSN